LWILSLPYGGVFGESVRGKFLRWFAGIFLLFCFPIFPCQTSPIFFASVPLPLTTQTPPQGPYLALLLPPFPES